MADGLRNFAVALVRKIGDNGLTMHTALLKLQIEATGNKDHQCWYCGLNIKQAQSVPFCIKRLKRDKSYFPLEWREIRSRRENQLYRKLSQDDWNARHKNLYNYIYKQKAHTLTQKEHNAKT